MSHTNSPIETRVAIHDVQLNRIISDLESEKETRARVHASIFDRFDKIEEKQNSTNKIIYMMTGGFIVVQVVLGFLKP